MQLDLIDEANGVTRVVLAGRMDIEGTNAIDMKFNVIAGSKSKVLVDLSGVEFLASLGMRTLVMAAKSVGGKGGRMVLLKPQPNVEKVLTTSGIDSVIPIFHDDAAALAQLG